MIGTLEIVVILVALLLLFGPDKIPELMRSAGIAMAEFKKAEQAARLSDNFDTSGFDKYNSEYRKQKKAESAALFEKVKSVAEESGIPTEGKSMDELLVLIEEKANAMKENKSDAVTEESGDSKDLATENVMDAANENTHTADSVNSADSTDLLNPATSVSEAKFKDAEIDKSSIETSSENVPKSRSYSGFGASDPAFASFVPGNSNSAAPAFSIPSATSSVHSGLLADIELAFGSGLSGSSDEQSGSSDLSDASDSTDAPDSTDASNESDSFASASSPLSLYDLNKFESAASASPRPSSGLLADVESAFGRKDSENVSDSGNVVENVD